MCELSGGVDMAGKYGICWIILIFFFYTSQIIIDLNYFIVLFIFKLIFEYLLILFNYFKFCFYFCQTIKIHVEEMVLVGKIQV